MDNTNKWKESATRGGIVLAFCAALFFVGEFLVSMKEFQYVGREIMPATTISVSAEGESFAIPDTAQFTFTVTEEASTVPEAQEMNTNKVSKVLDFLKESGVEDRDIKTVGYNIYPRYEIQERVSGGRLQPSFPTGERVLVGQVVSQTVSVKVRDTKKAGELLGGVGGLAVANVSSLQFTLDDEDAVRAEARAEAINKAQKKASQLAKDLDVRLVRVVSFSEGTNGGVMYRGLETVAADAVGKGSTPQIPAGENSFTSFVNITYEIK